MMEDSAAFNALKPVLEEFIKQPSKIHITKLTALIFKISPPTLQNLQDFIMYPLEAYLRIQLVGCEVKRHIVDCMRIVLQHTQFHDLRKLLDFYTLLFIQIFDHEKTNLVGMVPEELKLSVVQCVTTLVRQASSDVSQALCDKRHAARLAQGFYICMQLAQFEKLRPLRIAAIECVCVLAHVHSDDPVLRHQAGDVMMFFLPGIVSGMQRIAMQDEKQGHQVTLAAVKAWGEVIAVVMEDSDAPDVQVDQNAPVVSGEDLLAQRWDEESLQKKSRTPAWYRAAAEKLAMSAGSLGSVQQHSHRRVRQQLAATCTLLLSSCSRNMQPCVTHFLEMLIMLSEDESEEVATLSKSALESYSSRCEAEGGKPLLEILEENFYNLVSKFPRILHSTDDAQQLAAARLLAGYVNLLGARKLPQLLRSAAHLNRLVWTLIQAFEFDTSSVTLLEDRVVNDLEERHMFGDVASWKTFRHFTDQRVLSKMEDVCFLLGQYGDLNILTYHLLDLFNDSPRHRKEIIFLLNEIVCKSARLGDSSTEAVLQVYLEPSVWHVQLDADPDVSVGEVQSNVVQACLLVEGVGKMALALSPHLERFLLRTLYPVLERAGSGNGLVASVGMSAVLDIGEACGHGRDVTALVRANADYFSYHVTCKLRRLRQHPGVLDVLQVVMRCSSPDVLPCLEDVLNHVLMLSCDSFQDRYISSFLRVLHTFVVSVRQWYNVGESKESESDASVRTIGALELVDDLVEYHRCKRRVQDFGESGTFESVPESDCDATCGEKETRLPLHVQMTVSVLKRSLHFLPSRSREQRLLVLCILEAGLPVLQAWENELLPVVHAVWSPFVNRFADTSDPLVVNRSFSLLCIMAQMAKDFIRANTLKQVLQPLCEILSKAAPESRRKDKGTSYRFTQQFKLQLQLLGGLGGLTVDLGLPERQLDRVMTAALPYLSSLQPLPLQESCVKLFKKLSTLNRDAVWLKIVSLWSPIQHLSLPFSGLHTIKLPDRNTRQQEEFKKNAEDILSFVYWPPKYAVDMQAYKLNEEKLCFDFNKDSKYGILNCKSIISNDVNQDLLAV